MHGNFGGKRCVFERNCASDETWAVLGQRGYITGDGRGSRGDTQHIGAVVRWGIRKMGRILRRRTGQARAETRRRVSGAGLIS